MLDEEREPLTPEEGDHPLPAPDVGLLACARRGRPLVADRGVEIIERRIRRVLDARFAHQRVARQPHPAEREGRRPADVGALLEDQRFEAS